MNFRKICKQVLCRHDYKFVRYLHGDIRNTFSSVWQCEKCQIIKYSKYMNKA